MNVNDPPIIRWYAATLIFSCSACGAAGLEVPCVRREIMLLEAHSPDAAYDLAVERGHGHAQSATPCRGQWVAWEFAGLEELYEIPVHTTLDGAIVSRRVLTGLPASAFLHPKEHLSVFWPENGWEHFPPDHYENYNSNA